MEYAEVLNDLGLMDWFEEELDSAKRLLEQGLNIRLMIFQNIILLLRRAYLIWQECLRVATQL